MPSKTKPKSKQTKSRTAAANKATKKTATKKMAVKKEIPRKGMPKKKAVKTKARVQRKVTAPKKGPTSEPAFSLNRPGARSGRQSGDLQGLSSIEGAASESVAELIEEGNPYEADAVLGVERADDDEGEVQTHEVPEDDVPGEYLDED